MRIPSLLAVALLASACTTPKIVGDGDSSGDGDPSGEDASDDPSATDSVSGGASATADSGDTDIVPEGPYVDCAQLGADEPTVGPGEPGPLGFPIYACNPHESGESEFKCCSSDPSTADGELPAYAGKGISGSTPLYADAANDAGTWGMCVRTSDIPQGFGLEVAPGIECPIACNPTWSNADTETVCGSGRVCCQTIELGPKDCVLDSTTNLWRAVSGADIGSDDVSPATIWAAVSHDTHQDPNGFVCRAAVGCTNDCPENDAFLECIHQLTVADQRGYCMGLMSGQICPATSDSYVDACEAMNG